MSKRNLLVTMEIMPAQHDAPALDRYHNCFRAARSAYANRIGCDYVSIKGMDPFLPDIVLWQKFAVHNYLKDGKYDKVLFLDADVLVTPKAPNAFDLIDEGVAIVSDYWHENPGGVNPGDEEMMDLNSGFILCCRDSFKLFDIQTHRHLIPDYKNCCGWRGDSDGLAEQDYFRRKLKDSDLKIHHVSELWNYQPWYNDYADDRPEIVERRRKSGVSRFDAYMIHYTMLKNILPDIDYKIIFEGSKMKRLMWREIAALHDLCTLY